jgi:glycosidase
MAVRLSTVLQYSKGNELTAARDADVKRSQALTNLGAAVGVLPQDELDRVKARKANFDFAAGKAQAQANIVGLWAEHSRGGLPYFRWQGPDATENFYMSVKVNAGDAKSVTPELWTNINHNSNPSDFEAWPMQLVSTNGDTSTYQATVPVDRIGNFRVTGRIATNGRADAPNYQWASENGVGDLRFRPRAVQHEDISEEVVHVGLANSDGTSISTFRDLMDNSFDKFNIASIKASGKNTIRLQPPFEADRWANANPYDTLGSPYAATDFFSIDPRYSRDAQAIPSWDKDARRTAANGEFWQFVQECHRQGVKVLLDIALNHTGHNTTIRDLFDDPVKGEQVLRNNFQQLTINPEQDAVVAERVKNNPNGIGEELYPEMWAARSQDPAGAHSISEMVGGGNGEWADTKQLNHGGFNWGNTIYDTPQNRSVTDWLTRILKYWSAPPPSETGGVQIDGVDGFRLDHATNMPPEFYERSLTQLQAMVDKPLVFIDEDFNQIDRLRLYGDAMESGWYKDLIQNFKYSNIGGINSIVNSDYFYETLRGGNHDEDRIINQFDGDMMACGRYLSMLDLFGGISTMVMGDEWGEGNKLDFKHQGGVPPTLLQARHNQLPSADVQLQGAMRRAGDAKNSDPSLHTTLRTPLSAAGDNPNILAMSRHADDRNVIGTLVFANLANADVRSNVFWLDDETKSRLDPTGNYQARDLMSLSPGSAVWAQPITGHDLMNNGVYVKLDPYQIQALKLERV